MNNNGEITFDSFKRFALYNEKKLYDLFKTLDHNNDGFLDEYEVRTGLKKLGIENYSEQSLKRLIQQMDTNHDNNIDFSEWKNLLMLVPAENVDAVFRYWQEFAVLEEEDPVLVLNPPTEKIAVNNLWKAFVAGAVAGVVSRTCTAPIERLKVQFQVSTSKPPSVYRGLVDMYKLDGVKGLYKGNLANILKVAPEKALKFMVFETSKRFFAEDDYDLTPPQLFFCGSLSGVVTHMTLFPLEVVKTRLQGAPKGTYNGIADVLVQVSTKEGRILPFYRGLNASLLSTIPNSGINLMTYEMMKKLMYGAHPEVEPSLLGLALCGSVSSTFSQLSLYPLKLSQARLIMNGLHRVNDPSVPKATLISILRDTVKNEGARSLWKGFLPAILKSVPSHGITFGMYEAMKRVLGFSKPKKYNR